MKLFRQKQNWTKMPVLFVLGFCVYITSEVLFRGYSFPVMGLCGGISLVLLNMINDKISWDLDLLIQSAIGSGIITLMELVIGSICKWFDLVQMWDYSNMPLNFNGVICLPFSLVWMVMSVVGIFIADAISYYMYEELPVPYYKIFGVVVIKFREKHCNLHCDN